MNVDNYNFSADRLVSFAAYPHFTHCSGCSPPVQALIARAQLRSSPLYYEIIM